MKNIKFLFVFILIGCSSSKVVTDYDIKEDFSKFKTFEFYEDNGENLNEFDVKRITNSILQNLKNTGFEQHVTPDFFIYFDTKTVENLNRNTIGIGVGNGGIGVSGGIPIGSKKINEKLIIKFIEAKTNELFWEGSLNTAVKENRIPEKRKLHLEKVVQQILVEFPPKK
ncbi:hypothetical protein CW731_14605 [Polaribacter sp. ALD11]|uniref:DUF4136 domain-containing protein n=1 Tax=Polaribacter sp. ALD11 TaxID=2058137 RepID=UPI000C30EA47|nr:DUF4136 domain-containing protein [Polaribacter sp. ALD11]AUC86433.1 hypothetical protein CW731_14605 [Polaribacter sp. ALD11]